MLNNIRNFAKTKYASVLVAILIVPFVLWGMGGLFSGGNKNNIVKINKENISTLDFQKHLNLSNIELEEIKKNIDNNIIEEILRELISKKILLMEVNDLDLVLSDKILNKKIKKNKNFLDENNKFSRTKYEKFLLSNNITALDFEFQLRQNELKQNLFNFISGGVNSPLFLINNSFKDQTKKITVNYVNLLDFYKKKEDFTDTEITKFVEENKIIREDRSFPAHKVGGEWRFIAIDLEDWVRTHAKRMNSYTLKPVSSSSSTRSVSGKSLAGKAVLPTNISEQLTDEDLESISAELMDVENDVAYEQLDDTQE